MIFLVDVFDWNVCGKWVFGFWFFACVCVCVKVMDMLLVSSPPHLNAVLGPAGPLGTVWRERTWVEFDEIKIDLVLRYLRLW